MATEIVTWDEQPDPNDVLDFWLNFADILSPAGLPATGDTVNSVNWTVPNDLTLISEGYQSTYGIVWVTGGVNGRDYLLNCSITSVQGRTASRGAILKIKERGIAGE